MFCALLGKISGKRLQDHWLSGSVFVGGIHVCLSFCPSLMFCFCCLSDRENIRENVQSFKDSLRLSYGAGVVLRLGGIARLELNYVWPVWLLPGDR